MAIYFLDANGVERVKRTCKKVLDDPVHFQPPQQLPYYPHQQVHHAVYVTNGTPTSGRYAAKLQYRVEAGVEDTTPVWRDFSPSVTCWAISYDGEALKQDGRYHGFLVDEFSDPENDNLPVYAVQPYSGTVVPVFVTDGSPVSGLYQARLDYRAEDVPDWLPVDPFAFVWAIGYNGEALTADTRYKGLRVSTNPADGQPVYAVQPYSGTVAPVEVLSQDSDGYYSANLLSGYDPATKQFAISTAIKVVNLADTTGP